jgi:tRNA (guanine-N7-)-methyltransferase
MGRRALRKLSADLDLSEHLRVLEAMSAPFETSQHFAAEQVADSRPLEIEVGSGKGLFLANTAAAYPDRNYVGIEIAKKYAQHIAAQLSRRNLPNARIIHGDAEFFFREHLTDGQVAAVHVYFPDPWWKKRHHKRRIMNETFLLQVTRVLAEDGRLHFWTDVADYFQLALELIAERIPLIGPLEVAEPPAAHDLDYHTHFERRTRLDGQPVYRAEFVKRSNAFPGDRLIEPGHASG